MFSIGLLPMLGIGKNYFSSIYSEAQADYALLSEVEYNSYHAMAGCKSTKLRISS